MFHDRRPRERRFLEWKVGLFSVAAVLTIVGMYLEERWMTGTAIGVLAAAMLLRFLPGGGVVEDEEDPRGEADDAWGEEA